ncbi:unnamed protein product [Bursaphelenchus okinawaensis]|uniref:Peptidase C1A papain C-terminal domain-containing protein n=1 Tax=Bursaphelenchus okinawaensis TaxID=465554 RepID=A0A811L1F9_9BILA|nr:unnamed protein product [Bursaphelenchus okinawaensis]CAG9115018.1 unnamed protein product [Bursaphelenchus okinawaensis]
MERRWKMDHNQMELECFTFSTLDTRFLMDLLKGLYNMMVKMKALILFLAFISTKALPTLENRAQHRTLATKLSSQSVVESVNLDATSTFKTFLYPQFADASLTDIKGLMGVKEDHDVVVAKELGRSIKLGPKYDDESFKNPITLPTEFDSATQWPQCQDLINEIRDQSWCGSCWAVSSSSVLTDRLCIASNGTIKTEISAADLLECCDYCGSGCVGGYPYRAFHYVEQLGVVSGGNYTSHQGCNPYPFPPCHAPDSKNYPECKKRNFPTPKCQQKCQNGYSEHDYKHDKYYASLSYSYVRDSFGVMKEIVQRGPIVFAALEVYEDFLYYKSGVYQHKTGGYLGLHAVKVVGWGVENGTNYWKVANSWGPQWGENGFFKIRRGYNEANIEGSVNAVVVVAKSPSP